MIHQMNKEKKVAVEVFEGAEAYQDPVLLQLEDTENEGVYLKAVDYEGNHLSYLLRIDDEGIELMNGIDGISLPLDSKGFIKVRR